MKRHIETGFSLVEMAVVLAIITLLLGGMLPMISSQVEKQHRNETRQQLDEIRSALLGFAVANGRLPCPDTDNDGAENFAASGVTAIINDAPVTGQNTRINTPCNGGGTIPFNTLGTSQTDGFGGAFIYNVTPIYAGKNVERWLGPVGTGTLLSSDPNGRFLLNDSGTLFVCTATTNAATTPCPTPRLIDNAVAVVLSSGSNWAQVSSYSVEETENTDKDGDFISHDNTPTFDDLVIWISPNTLFNRMVSAGKLP
jgi:prepilin-type N-terminal cleavage/methylation domain-containing protein